MLVSLVMLLGIEFIVEGLFGGFAALNYFLCCLYQRTSGPCLWILLSCCSCKLFVSVILWKSVGQGEY